MAVPKKKTSKSKRSTRKSNWNKKILKHITFAKTISSSILNKDSNSFLYLTND